MPTRGDLLLGALAAAATPRTGHDGDGDVHPPQPGLARWVEPVHMIAIPCLGLPLTRGADLEAIATACAEEGRWDFFLTLASGASRARRARPSTRSRCSDRAPAAPFVPSPPVGPLAAEPARGGARASPQFRSTGFERIRATVSRSARLQRSGGRPRSIRSMSSSTMSPIRLKALSSAPARCAEQRKPGRRRTG